jgi:plasmid stability protein
VNPKEFPAELKRFHLYKLAVRDAVVAAADSSGPVIDRKPAFWEYGEMKTTLDLPDDLMHEVKIRAVHEHKKLKDAIAEFLRKGLAAGKTQPPKIPKPVKLRGGFIPTTEDIEAAIAEGRD